MFALPKQILQILTFSWPMDSLSIICKISQNIFSCFPNRRIPLQRKKEKPISGQCSLYIIPEIPEIIGKLWFSAVFRGYRKETLP